MYHLIRNRDLQITTRYFFTPENRFRSKSFILNGWSTYRYSRGYILVVTGFDILILSDYTF